MLERRDLVFRRSVGKARKGSASRHSLRASRNAILAQCGSQRSNGWRKTLDNRSRPSSSIEICICLLEQAVAPALLYCSARAGETPLQAGSPAGDGTAPICCSIPIWSNWLQFSTILPPTKRCMPIPVTDTGLPVGGKPAKSPPCVPRADHRTTTLSPSAMMSSTVIVISGNTVRYKLTACLSPSASDGKPSGRSCGVKMRG